MKSFVEKNSSIKREKNINKDEKKRDTKDVKVNLQILKSDTGEGEGKTAEIDGEKLCCFLCQKPNPAESCPKCSLPSCPQHLSDHRRGEVCLPFIVTQKEGVGRCVIASRDIRPMELILVDTPLVVGPNYETEAVCLECLSRVDGSFLCPHCSLPLCGKDCAEGPRHESECQVFRQLEKQVLVPKFGRGTIAHEYGCITVLRLLSVRDNSPELWERLGYLMDHDQERRKEVLYWKMFQRNVVDFLRLRVGLAEVYSEDEIHRAIGLLRTNAFNVEKDYMANQGTSGKALYPTFSFFSHSCISNARYIVQSDDSLEMRAKVDIKKGEEITIQYISFLFGNSKRRKDIKACWMFECLCPRCRDVTEFGTFLSALLCQVCQAPVLPEDSKVDCALWRCQLCPHSLPISEVEEIMSNLEEKMFDTYDTERDKYRALIEQYSKVLHPQNFQMLLLKRYLATSLRGQLTISEVEEKVKLQEDFINVFKTVDPGLTCWRGKMLFEVAKTNLFLADFRHTRSQINKDEFTKIVETCVSDMLEVLSCLRHEPEDSSEKKIFLQTEASLRNTKDVLQFMSVL